MERYPHLSVYLSPETWKLPYEDASFAAVLSCGVLEHVADPDASLEEVKRILARDHQDRPRHARRLLVEAAWHYRKPPPRHHPRPPPASPTPSGTRDGTHQLISV